MFYLFTLALISVLILIRDRHLTMLHDLLPKH